MIVRLSDNRHPAVDCLYRIFVYGVWVRWFDAFVCGHCCGREDMVCLSSGANTVSAHRCTPQINYEQKKNLSFPLFFCLYFVVVNHSMPPNAQIHYKHIYNWQLCLPASNDHIDECIGLGSRIW